MSNYFINLGFQSLEKRLQKSAGRYAVGDRLSFADICIVPQVISLVLILIRF
jgi:glutathione S-transferase